GRLPAGPAGPPGPQGPRGPAGGVDTDALANVVRAALADARADMSHRVIIANGDTKEVLSDKTYQFGEPVVLDVAKLASRRKTEPVR
ncbi:MAG: hypothetical protein NXI32_30035, partial [bacterium]|nr:hypothetical protein [bacterium]